MLLKNRGCGNGWRKVWLAEGTVGGSHTLAINRYSVFTSAQNQETMRLCISFSFTAADSNEAARLADSLA
jgi:hypothetical protein